MVKFLIFFMFSIFSLSFALDILEPYPTSKLQESYQEFGSLLKRDWAQEAPQTDEQKIVADIKRNPKCAKSVQSVLFIDYLTRLVTVTPGGQSMAPQYARMLQATLRGSHCNGINTSRAPTPEERNIMVRAAQKVGELTAPWLLILDLEKRSSFVRKDSDYWRGGTPFTDKLAQDHVNIVTAITKSTTFSALNVFRECHKQDPLEDDAKSPHSLRLALDGYKSHRSMAVHLPYGPVTGEFDRFISHTTDLHAARVAIGWIAFLVPQSELNEETATNSGRLEPSEPTLLPDEKVITAGLRKYEPIDSQISAKIKKSNEGKDERPWASWSEVGKVRAVQKSIDDLKERIGLEVSEAPQAPNFDLKGFKRRLTEHLNVPSKMLMMADSVRSFVSQLTTSEPTTFGISDSSITDLASYILQHTNISQNEFEKAAQLGLMIGMPMAAKNPTAYNPFLRIIFNYLTPRLGDMADLEAKAEALTMLRSFDYSQAYELLKGDDLREARGLMLDFLKFAILQKTYLDIRAKAMYQFECFLWRAWCKDEPLALPVVEMWNIVSVQFPKYRKDVSNRIWRDDKTYKEYLETRKK